MVQETTDPKLYIRKSLFNNLYLSYKTSMAYQTCINIFKFCNSKIVHLAQEENFNNISVQFIYMQAKSLVLVRTILICSVLFLANSTIAQKRKIKLSQTNLPENHDSIVEQNKNVMITPYAAPSYSPELDILFTVGGLISFKMQSNNPLLSRSSIPFSAGYSSNGATAITILPYIYGKNNLYKIQTSFYYKDMPDDYWGIGYDEGTRTSTPNNTTHYERKWWSISGQIVFKIKDNLFLGPLYDINSTKAENMNTYMSNDANIIAYGSNINNIGLGIVLELDERDNAQNPYKGYLLSFGYTNYNAFVKSNKNRFNKFAIDARKYFSIGYRKTIAFQLNSKYTKGDIPWSEMPQIGTPYDLRGYKWGRFRDKSATFGIIEYRHMLTRRKQNNKGNFDSRWGFVGWVGAGTVAPNYKDWNNWLPNIGVGVRAEIQPRMNLRVDYGRGKDSGAIYVTFSEAF